jgi:serine/threonine protein kinase
MRTRVEEIFHDVADLPLEARAHYFADRDIDVNTRAEVEALVAFDCRTSMSLERDIGQVAQRTLARCAPNDLPCGPYRLGDFLGRGGMGTVHLAERVDGEVTQRVAVKLLRPGADDPQLRQRFLAERQILATLSHPNIARLLDAGHREDGQPYLVMEYVEGKTIDVYAAGLGIRQKITLFLKVCAAVSYLHRNLVVHRDLKPANILVSDEGEPKLLDFGIAKMLDLTTDYTVTNMRMLTPDYASPEQVDGSPVSTATDVYSLGAVLYKLLTGASPRQFEGNSAGAIACAISTGRITPPAKLAPGLKGDLEIILMKALRREPQERYATIEHFSEDLECYLESRPIRARKGDAWYRTRKFLRRYWLQAAAATLAVAGLSGGALVANHERAIAQRRFVQVRQLANKLFDIDAEVRQTPGTTNARELIVSTSLDYLQRVAEDVQGDPTLALELGNAYMRVGRVQGVPTTSNLGHEAEADRSLQKAEALLRSVFTARPADQMAILRSAQIAHDRMMLAGDRGASEEEQAFARTSAEWLRKYESSGKVDPLEAEGVAITYMNVGTRYVLAGRYDEGIRLAERAFDIARSAGNAKQAGSALISIAKAYRQKGDLDRALQTIRESVRMLEPPAQTVNRSRTTSFVTALMREGQILGEDNAISLGKSEEAVASLDRAFTMAEKTVHQDANDANSRGLAAAIGIVLADILRHVDPVRAVDVYDRALSDLAGIHNNTRARLQEVRALAGSTYPLRRLGRTAEVKLRLDGAFERLTQLKLFPTERIEPGSEADETLCALADYEAGKGDVVRAIDIYQGLLDQILAAKPKPEMSLEDAVNVSRVNDALASLHRRASHTDLASALEARRLELWRCWDAKLPHNSFVRRQLNAANEHFGKSTSGT